jgi:hypothetical protein
VEQLNQDGQSYKVMDIRAKAVLVRNILPTEMIVGQATRAEDDPVIKLLKQVKIDAHPFLDPRLTRPESAEGEFRTPASRMEAYEPQRRSSHPS